MKKYLVNKRPKLMTSGGGSESNREKEEVDGTSHRPNSMEIMEIGGLTVAPSQYNPLDEPLPLGLRLKKSPSLLELIQTELSQASTPPAGGPGCSSNKVLRPSSASSNRLKASRFHGILLRIGTWEYKSRHVGDLVAKCYYVRRKLVWEVLDGGLKRKIEILWSDIVDLKRTSEDDGSESLIIVLERQPIFFREVDPQPRKHTLWEATTDFTGGQASIHKQHFMECPRGSMGKHIEKMIQCDPHLLFVSQQEQSRLDSMCFEDQKCVDPIGRHSGSYSHETLSSSSALPAAIDTSNNKFEELKELSNWDSIMVPGMRPSTSMSDQLIHLESRVSKQGMSSNPTFSSEEWQNLQIMDNINCSLFSDVENLPDPDEKSLISRVNSLCRLLQNDDDNPTFESEGKPNESFGALLSDELLTGEKQAETVDEKNAEDEGRPNMWREDSGGDLLLNLPRVASLPHILLDNSEDGK